MGWRSRGRPGRIVSILECVQFAHYGETHGCVVNNGRGDNNGGVGRAHGDGRSAAGDGDTGGCEDGDGGHVIIHGRGAVGGSGSRGDGGSRGGGGRLMGRESSDNGSEGCEGEGVLHFDFDFGRVELSE